MKILINRKPVEGPWGGGNLFVRAFCDYFTGMGHKVVHKLEHDVDVMFMQDPRYSDLGISINELLKFKQMNPSVPLIHRVNECDARKGTNDIDKLLRECSKYTDLTIFVSNWMEEHHREKGWNCDLSSVVYNGVNQDHFKKRKKIDNGKINIVTHHWSDNPLKGEDVYEFLDDLVGRNPDTMTFTYIGRTKSNFKNSKVVKPLFGLDLGKELSKYDIYVSGSRNDPGPNHILESLSCEIPTICHLDGGGAVEFCGDNMTFSDLNHLKEMIQMKNLSNNKIIVYDWNKCMSEVMKSMELVCDLHIP